MYLKSLACLAPLVSAYVLPDADISRELPQKDGFLESPQWPSLSKAEAENSFKYWLNYAEARQEKYLGEVHGFLGNLVDTFENVADSATEYFKAAAENVHAYTTILREQQEGKDVCNFLGDDDTLEGFDLARAPFTAGHGGHHHHKPNLTVYELISKSRYTTKLAELIDEFPDLVKALNGTEANYTVFAPTDRAFAKIPHHGDKKPSKEQLREFLTYHVSPKFYPAGRILVSRTIPSLLNSDELGSDPLPQRLVTDLSLRGLTINFYSRVVAADIFGTNGVIHGVDSILLPPPRALKIIEFLPAEFSTLELALEKTGLLDELRDREGHGGTFFAPGNRAWQNLPTRLTAFLFSPSGQKYLKALLKYHVVPDTTFYSDALYPPPKHHDSVIIDKSSGQFQVELPTLLNGKTLLVTVSRWGRLINIGVNAQARVEVRDGIARDGVIHTLSGVLIPPRKLSDGRTLHWNGEWLGIDDFKARLEPFVDNPDAQLIAGPDFDL